MRCYAAQQGGGNRALRIAAADPRVIELFDNESGFVVAEASLAGLRRVEVIGTDSGNDLLTVDFSEPFWLSEGIRYSGGEAGFDGLVLRGNGAAGIPSRRSPSRGGRSSRSISAPTTPSTATPTP